MNNRMAIAALVAAALTAAGAAWADATNTVVRVREFPIPRRGVLSMGVPASWACDIRQLPGDLPPTIIMSPNQGDDFKALVTVLWDSKGDAAFSKPETAKRLIENDLEEMRPGAVEETVRVRTFAGRDGKGYYFFVTDKAPRPGEYPYAVRANVGVGEFLLTATVLCRSKDSAGVTETIKALETAEHKREVKEKPKPANNASPASPSP
jgi:hypothetical protein